MNEITRDKRFIGKMFDEISPTYDRLNHIISGRQDLRWRRKALKVLQNQDAHYKNILDLASGSGDLAAELVKLSPDYVFSADLSIGMLNLNKRKINFSNNVVLRTDALHLPFQNCLFDLVGISFGVRNFENLKGSVKEIYRVLKKGGRFLTIEMFRNPSRNFILKSFSFYFSKIVPKIGNLISRSNYAYNYLFRSVDTFLTVDEYENLLKDAGFEVVYSKNNFLGIVNTIIAKKSNKNITYRNLIL